MNQVIARAQLTITTVYDGADAYNVFLSANAVSIPCNADGSDPVLLAARSTVTVMQAGVDITHTCTLALVTRLNCGATLVGQEIVITKIDLGQLAGYVEIAVTVPTGNDQTITTNHRLTWSLNRQGTAGADGEPGPSLTSAGYWLANKVYYMRPDVRTRVMYKVDGKNYLTKRSQIVTAIPMGTLPTDQRYWSVFDGQFDLVATNILFAEDAYIAQVNTPAIWVGSGIKGWKIHQEQIESVQQINGVPKTRLTSNGDIEITGGSLKVLSGTSSQSLDEYTKQQLDNLQIGGRNLLINSNFATQQKDPWNQTNTCEIVKDSRFGYCAKVWGTRAYAGIFQVPQRDAAGEYAWSVWIKAGADMTCRIAHEGGSGTTVVNVGTEWKLYTGSGYWEGKTGAFCIYSNGNFGVFYVANAKYEKGSKATDWSPAPEDIQKGIEQLGERVSSTQSKIEQTAERITLEVGAIQIGGRNYFAHTDWVQGGYFADTGKLVANSNAKRIRPSKSAYVEAFANVQYCFRDNNQTYQGCIYELDTNGNVLKEHDWQNGDYKFTTKPTTTHFALIGRKADNSNITPAEIWKFRCKLEKGDKFTDYTPAPEDIQGQIDAKATLDQVKAGIKITADGVEAFGNAFKINGVLLAHLINTDGLNVGNGNFVVEKDGKFTSKDATIEGVISSVDNDGNEIVINAKKQSISVYNNAGLIMGEWSYNSASSDAFSTIKLRYYYAGSNGPATLYRETSLGGASGVTIKSYNTDGSIKAYSTISTDFSEIGSKLFLPNLPKSAAEAGTNEVYRNGNYLMIK